MDTGRLAALTSESGMLPIPRAEEQKAGKEGRFARQPAAAGSRGDRRTEQCPDPPRGRFRDFLFAHAAGGARRASRGML